MGGDRFGEVAAFCFAIPAGFLALLAADAFAAPAAAGRDFGFLGTAFALARPALESGSGIDAIASGPTLLYLLVAVLLFGTAGVLLAAAASDARPGTIAVGLALPALLMPLASWFLDVGGFRSHPPEPADRVGYYVPVFAALVVGAVFLTGLLAGWLVSRIRE